MLGKKLWPPEFEKYGFLKTTGGTKAKISKKNFRRQTHFFGVFSIYFQFSAPNRARGVRREAGRSFLAIVRVYVTRDGHFCGAVGFGRPFELRKFCPSQVRLPAGAEYFFSCSAAEIAHF